MKEFKFVHPEFQPGFSLFGVMRGVGGVEVARFVSENFLAELRKNPSFIAE